VFSERFNNSRSSCMHFWLFYFVKLFFGKSISFVYVNLVKLLTNCLKLQEIKLCGNTVVIVSTESLHKKYRPIPSPLLYEHAIAIIVCKYHILKMWIMLNDFLNVFWELSKVMFLFTLLYMPIFHVTILKYP